jgi:hypothetical protein
MWPTVPMIAERIEHTRQGVLPGREAVAINEIWRSAFGLLHAADHERRSSIVRLYRDIAERQGRG